MEKQRHVAFWIAFPIAFAVLLAVTLFYFDLANGPLVVFILALVNLALLAVINIALLRYKKRWRLIPWGVFLVVFSILFSTAQTAIEPWPAVTHSNVVHTEALQLRNGKVRGVYSEDGEVEVYAGVPYAKPPVGELRWKEPEPCADWEGVKDCDYFAPCSMQSVGGSVMNTLVDMYAERSWHPDYRMYPFQNTSEDSLYLNIWRPKNITGKLPILIYIHGGSLTSGSSASQSTNGEAMAHQGVIMITIQYRLGVFGYFAHPDLAEESPNHTTGNYGLLDQVMALRWVADNAEYFGGDKDQVTIAGESAGSSSVSALCVSPLAKGLFRYAIGESSSVIMKNPPHTFRSYDKAKQTGVKIMEEMGCTSIEQMRELSPERLLQTQYSNSGMTIDGYALTEAPYLTYEKGENNETRLLNGYNVKEGDAFVVPGYLFSPTNKDNIRERLLEDYPEATVDKLLEYYKDRLENDAFSVFNEIYSIDWFIHPHDCWSRYALNNGETVYRYQFTKENGYYGTYHSGEIIYAYGNLSRSAQPFAYDESDHKLSATMLGYWSNFVKYGDPNGDGLPTWAPYAVKGAVQELGENVGPIDDHYRPVYEILEAEE